MTSVEERLKLKRAQIDTWSVREQLCLASSVLRSGDQNWMSVSRSLKVFGDPGRPPDWFSQKSCAVQYSNLLENVETPKRKKRTDKADTTVETPSESIVRRLTQERIEELKRLLNEDRKIYKKLKEEVMIVKSGCGDDKLDDMCQEIEEEKRQKVRKVEAHENWLKEREEKKKQLERAWKPTVAPASPLARKNHPKVHRRNSSQSEPSSEAESAQDSPVSEHLNVDVIGEETIQETQIEPEPSQTPTSPLLTSLLKSPTQAPTSQGSSILHSAITSHRGTSPTITSLLSSAPGLPGAGNAVTVAPPATVSSSLKNLVSNAISSEQAHHQPPPHNPSPAAGAPTLSMLLELPPSLPGKPLPELPSVAKTILPPSTVTAIVSSVSIPTSATVRVGPGTVISNASSKTSSISVNGSSEVQSSIQEVKTADSTIKGDEIKVLQMNSTQNVDAQQLSVNAKEDLLEEVLIEEVVVNDDSVIESELLSSEISDVMVADDKETKGMVKDGETKPDEAYIEVTQSTNILPEKDIETEIVVDVDNSSNKTELSENTDKSIEKQKDLESILDASSQELVSELVTEETAVEMVSTSETEITTETVAEVIEITNDPDPETPIQAEECGPCIQELEDMEVIILDKVQGLDEVHIVEDMKELECEVVEVVMGAHEKVEDVKEETDDSFKSEEVTSDENFSVLNNTITESKRPEQVDSAIKEGELNISVMDQKDNIDVELKNVKEENVESNIPQSEEKERDIEEIPNGAPDMNATENSYVVDDDAPQEMILEGASNDKVPDVKDLDEEINYDKDLDENVNDNHEEVVSIGTSESCIEKNLNEDLREKELNIKESEITSSEIEEEEEDEKEENAEAASIDKDVIDNLSEKDGQEEEVPVETSVINESEEESDSEDQLPKNKKEKSSEDDGKTNKDVKTKSSKEEFTKDIKEPLFGKRYGLRELSKKDEIVKENTQKRHIIGKEKEILKKDDVGKSDEKKHFQIKKQEEHQLHDENDQDQKDLLVSDVLEEEKSLNEDAFEEELQNTNEVSVKVMKETSKKDAEKMNTEDKENAKERKEEATTVEDQNVEVKEDEKDKREIETPLTKDYMKKDSEIDVNVKKNIPRELPKRDPSHKREFVPCKKDVANVKKEISISRREVSLKDSLKENQTKRELPRRESKEDSVRKEELKRNSTKEERKEFTKDESKRRSNKEIVKASNKSEMDIKGSESTKTDLAAKTDRIKKERTCKENQQKGVDRDKDVLSKEPKAVSNAKLKLSGEDFEKFQLEKKDVKVLQKESDKNEAISKQEVAEKIEEKHEKRAHLRSEASSFEDDKSNDAEPPRVVGRKRLAAVNVVDSIPNSPASTTDEEREYKSWKKSIMLLYGRLAAHKYASLFLRPITDDQAPGYSSVIQRPIDLMTIKKNIETGVIRTTLEFQRDILLMFQNSIMYNKSDHLVHKMAKQMQTEGMQHIQDYITTQMLVQVVGDGVPIRRETRTTEANKQRDLLANPSNIVVQDDVDGIVLQKRKRNTASDSSDRSFKRKKVDE